MTLTTAFVLGFFYSLWAVAFLTFMGGGCGIC